MIITNIIILIIINEHNYSTCQALPRTEADDSPNLETKTPDAWASKISKLLILAWMSSPRYKGSSVSPLGIYSRRRLTR